MKKNIIPILGLSLLTIFTSCSNSKSEEVVIKKGEYELQYNESDLNILTSSQVMKVSQTLQLETNYDGKHDLKYSLSNDNLTISKDGLITARKTGLCFITVSGNDKKDVISIMVENASDISSDPYENVNVDKFYKNYTEASSYMDAYYRTQHNLMSGAIEVDDANPSEPSSTPKINGSYVRNTSAIYSSDKKTYYVVNGEGNIVDAIYSSGAYRTLNEVAPFILAFGDVPTNYEIGNKTKPTSSEWGEYLVVNHNEFSGDTEKYPYEPVLPNISGCGGDFQYYELDVATTGTDGSGTPALYNNGKYITRGAARLIYSRYMDKNETEFSDISKRYVFYTYNHYNDFQEYLNYQGGFGEMFGNISGGGTLSSKIEYNPTKYVSVEYSDLNNYIVNYQNLNNKIVYYICKKDEDIINI